MPCGSKIVIVQCMVLGVRIVEHMKMQFEALLHGRPMVVQAAKSGADKAPAINRWSP